MNKVLIVDDEVLVRVGLKTTIDWETVGFTVVAEASNGEQGYDQYKKHTPDLIITDIRMPKKDGIWLIEEVRKDNQDIKILVLTCYDEFSYARKALKAGADDYILKSEVEDEELLTIMRTIKKKIDAQNKRNDIHSKVKKNRDDIKRALFSDMIKLDFNMDSKMIDQCNNVQFSVVKTNFAFVGIAIGEDNSKARQEVETVTTGQINQAVMNIFFDKVMERDIEFLYRSNKKNQIFLLSSSKINTLELKRIFTSVSHAAKQYFDRAINIVYTEPFIELSQLMTYYKEFSKKAQILFYNHHQSFSITDINAIHFKDVNVFDLKKIYNKQFIEFIGQENNEKTKELIGKISRYFEDDYVNPKSAKIVYSNLIGDIFNSYGQLFSNNKKIKNHEYYHYQIINAETQQEITQLLLDFTYNIITEMSGLSHSHSKLLINRALNYIEHNFERKISLEDVAVRLGLSKHYLCNIFKKEIGETMSLYINKLRIEKAKKMLLKPDSKIKEIFEEVGFSNQQYFSKVFKKITGMTMMEYKENIKTK